MQGHSSRHVPVRVPTFVTHRNPPGQKPPWTGSHELAPSCASSLGAPSGVAAASFEAVVFSPEQLPDVAATITTLSLRSDHETADLTFTITR